MMRMIRAFTILQCKGLASQPELKKKLQLAVLVCLTTIICLVAAGLRFKSVTIFCAKPEAATRKQTPIRSDEIRHQLYLDYMTSTSTLGSIVGIKKKKRLPDVIGIGAEKCGTGPLRWMLLQHPMIFSSDPAEMHFFDTKKQNRGIQYYRNHMPEVAEYELVFEKSPAYFNFGSRYLPRMMKQDVPDAKLIVILCDPVNRTFSDYVHEIRMRSISNDTKFETVIMQILAMLAQMPKNSLDDTVIEFIYKMLDSSWKSHIVTTGMYYYHLVRWFEAYNNTDVHIVDGEELLSDPGSTLEKVQEFLGIPKLIIKEDFVHDSSGFYCVNPPRVKFTDLGVKLYKANKSNCMHSISKGRTRMGSWEYKPSQAILESLRRFYAPHNKKLFSLLGRKFDWQLPYS